MITRWNPMRDMIEMQNQIDRMFDDAWKPLYSQDNLLPLDVDETETGYTISAAVPGMNPEDIHVNIQDNVLTISGESNSETERKDENGERVLMRERRYGKFSRSVCLARPVNADGVEASYENGVLMLSVPKDEKAAPRRIPVNTRQQIADATE